MVRKIFFRRDISEIIGKIVICELILHLQISVRKKCSGAEVWSGAKWANLVDLEKYFF